MRVEFLKAGKAGTSFPAEYYLVGAKFCLYNAKTISLQIILKLNLIHAKKNAFRKTGVPRDPTLVSCPLVICVL